MKINEKNMCVFASNPPYDCEGFLNKRGEVNKAFQRRYFVLKGNLLFYFEKNGDKEPLGLIIVEGCTIELSAESDQYCFEIAFNGNRTYVLSADSQENMEIWMKALTCAGYEYKKLMVAELQRQLEEIEGSRNKILSESISTAESAPKPPPRRINPFNRPAPPLPTTNANCSSNTNAPFINGHFGSASQRTNTNNETQTGHNDGSPVPPPRGISSASSAVATSIGSSEFYLQSSLQGHTTPQHKASVESTVYNNALPSTVAVVKPSINTRNHSATSTALFEQSHEKFRSIIMKDMLTYRTQQQLKVKPLIEF